MFLIARITAEAIPGVHGEIDQITVEMFAVLAQIGWFGFPIPFNAGAVRVDQLFVEPLGHYLSVVGGIRSVTLRVCWCLGNRLERQTNAHDRRDSKRSGGFHGSHSVP